MALASWHRHHATGSDDGVGWGCGRWDVSERGNVEGREEENKIIIIILKEKENEGQKNEEKRWRDGLVAVWVFGSCYWKGDPTEKKGKNGKKMGAHHLGVLGGETKK